MKSKCHRYSCALIFSLIMTAAHSTDNQTDELSPIQFDTSLPFRITIERANFQLPSGVHSGVVGIYNGLWVFIAGRLNGMHGFGADSFPILEQNRSIFVVNPLTGVGVSRSLNDPSSGLSQEQIDTLSVTSPEGYQSANTLYMAGGYGINTNTGAFDTKPVLTAINLPGIVKWVTEPGDKTQSVAQNIQQNYNSAFQITGGRMYKLGNVTQLIFGQNYSGEYTPGKNGNYSEQVRKFQISNESGPLTVAVYPSQPQTPDPSFRRRDINIVPVLLNKNNRLQYGVVAYAGVFTPQGGVWTVPVVLNETGDPVMANPLSPSTFKQGMNQYVCATAGLYSKKYKNMYTLFFGGISYSFYNYNTGDFDEDVQLPFINQVTTIKMDSSGNFTQYLMSGEYPAIESTDVNPGNFFLFGAGAYFIPAAISHYANQVINLDNIRKPTVIGYVAGGIASTLPHANVPLVDTFASPYVFKVTLIPK